MPSDVAAEQAVLGAVMLSPSTIDRARGLGLRFEDFWSGVNRLCFRRMCEVYDAGHLDIVTLAGHLEDKDELAQVGGYGWLAGLAGKCPTVAGIAAYMERVVNLSRLRELDMRCMEIREHIRESPDDLATVLDQAESRVLSVRRDSASKLVPTSAIVPDVYEELQRRAANPQDVTGLRTGFVDLDRLLAGLQRTDLIILAARPAMGKTAFALNLLAQATLREGATAAFFSLEMSKEQLVTRLMTQEARVSGTRMRTGRLRDDDWGPLHQATEAIARAPLHIDDEPGLTVEQVRGRCRQMRKLDLVVVDYLQLMRGSGNEGSREQEISAISRGLKGLAKEMSVPVLALSQLNRGVEQRVDKRPLMSDLRESGAIEQDADVIMFLFREEVYTATAENAGAAEVLVRKQRNGGIGDINLLWRAEQVRFDNLARL